MTFGLTISFLQAIAEEMGMGAVLGSGGEDDEDMSDDQASVDYEPTPKRSKKEVVEEDEDEDEEALALRLLGRG